MRTIETQGITVTNEFDVRGQALLALIKKYIPGFAGAYYGFKPLGSNDINFPAIFVEPSSQDPKLETTGKYTMKWQYTLYFYVVESTPEAIVTLAASAAEALVKLFSNNALGDIGSGNTNKFKAYDPYWVSSEMLDVSLSPTFQSPNPNGPTLMRAGRMRLEIEDYFVK